MFRHILVPTDGSRLSMRAADCAIKLARLSRGRITAFHAIPAFRSIMPYMDSVVTYPELYSLKEYERTTEEHARKMLGLVAKRAAAAKVKCEIAYANADRPWEQIIQEARKRRCDLIVMASHGRRGLEGVLVGSETTKVLTHSKTPVLVTR